MEVAEMYFSNKNFLIKLSKMKGDDLPAVNFPLLEMCTPNILDYHHSILDMKGTLVI